MGSWWGIGGFTLSITNHLVDKHEDYEWYRTYMDENGEELRFPFLLLDEQ
jgi:hypothetical protein